jgi:single-strand DNA-binding protein
MAISRQFRNAEGTSREEVVFVEVDSFGRQAETIAHHLAKGRPILVEGRLKLDQWESQSGEKRSKLLVVMESFQFLGAPRSDGDRDRGFPGDGQREQGARPQRNNNNGGRKERYEENDPNNLGEDMGEEIPF